VIAVKFDGDPVLLPPRASDDADGQATATPAHDGDVWLPRRADGRFDDQ